MNHRAMALLFSAGLLAGLCRGEAPAPHHQMAWQQELLDAPSSGQLCRILLAREVFDGCHNFPYDLRIQDETGQAWPFFIWTPATQDLPACPPVETLNTSLTETPARYWRQDLRIRPPPGQSERPRHNQLILQTSGSDFLRRVEIYAGENGEDWALLGSGWLVNHAREVMTENRVIRYPVSDFPFLQVRVYPNARNEREDFSIVQITPGFLTEPEQSMEDVPLAPLEVPAREQRPGVQTLLFDLGASNRPVEKLQLSAAGEYARAVRVFGRNQLDHQWRWAAEGEIHSLGPSLKNSLPLRGFMYRYMKVDIFHFDDPPLDGLSVLAGANPRYLVVETKGGRTPRLYYGADQVQAPRFDLARRTPERILREAPLAKLGPRKPNSTPHPAAPWARNPRLLATLIVALVSLLVLWVVTGMFKKMAG